MKMKKLMVFALATLCSVSMSAQDIKTILGANDYKEALNMIKAGEASLSNENKAKAYNKVVDLALDKFLKEQVTKADPAGMYDAAETAIQAALECDKYDNMPNEKGKVKPKFSKNGTRLAPVRASLVAEGEARYNEKDYKGASRAFGMYVDTNSEKLFATGQPDQFGPQIAYFAALSSFYAQEFDRAERYSDAALNDSTYANDAMTLKLNALQNTMKTKADSIAVQKKLEDLYAKFPNNQAVFSTLTGLLLSQGKKDEFNKLIDNALAVNPKNFAAVAMRGQSYMNERKWQEAIDDLKKALEIMPDNIPVTASVGNCYMYLAQEKAEQISAKTNGRIPKAAEDVIVGVYNQAIDYLTKAKDMDKNMEYKTSWAYSLYTCLYRTLGDEDPKTKEAEALTK